MVQMFWDYAVYNPSISDMQMHSRSDLHAVRCALSGMEHWYTSVCFWI